MDVVNRTLEWINKTWTDKVCPYCKGNKYSIVPEIYEITSYSTQIIPEEKRMIPCIAVICKTCGVITIISSNKIGL